MGLDESLGTLRLFCARLHMCSVSHTLSTNDQGFELPGPKRSYMMYLWKLQHCRFKTASNLAERRSMLTCAKNACRVPPADDVTFVSARHPDASKVLPPSSCQHDSNMSRHPYPTIDTLRCPCRRRVASVSSSPPEPPGIARHIQKYETGKAPVPAILFPPPRHQEKWLRVVQIESPTQRRLKAVGDGCGALTTA